MATSAQITANRLNALNSTGPRTAAGKATSSRNAVRHNLSPGATFTLLPGEDRTAFEQLVQDYRTEFKPQTAHETFLVHQMIQAQWRISRIERLQAELLDKILNAPIADNKSDEAALVAVMNSAPGDALDKLERYGRAAERAYFRANKELKQYRATQKQNEPKPTAAEATDRAVLATRSSPIATGVSGASRQLATDHWPLTAAASNEPKPTAPEATDRAVLATHPSPIGTGVSGASRQLTTDHCPLAAAASNASGRAKLVINPPNDR